MDRPIDPRVRRSRRLRLALRVVGVVLGLAVLALLLAGWARPSVRRQGIRTAVVARGPLEATVTASGTVVPEHEQVLSSPLDTRLLEVLVPPGTAVQQGQALVRLDVGEATLALEKLGEQIALKHVESQSESIATRQTLTDLQAQRDIRKLEVESASLTVERNQALFDKGIVSGNDLRAAQMELEKARLELRRLEENVQQTGRASAARLHKLELERSILGKERDEAARLLELATARADRDGVLTYVLQDEGASVHRGDVIARVADLGSFRIETRVPDVRATSLATGMAARVALGDTILDGQVSRILPEVENGTITVLVDLMQRTHAGLRPNRRVDVHLVTARTEGTLCVARGPVVRLGAGDVLFVVRGDAAVRTPVRLGIANFAQQEILEGLAEGDEVVISDMSEYAHVKEVKLR
ncbi:MAG TPA: efflux RND transporter periplasmic adaptor subunit [Candidatus Krumholzibacteria bacterium]|nr:efflux RND transporter periplasmic adaptor subunit [Candidatus Krumholzibacteria bacterium]